MGGELVIRPRLDRQKRVRASATRLPEAICDFIANLLPCETCGGSGQMAIGDSTSSGADHVCGQTSQTHAAANRCMAAANAGGVGNGTTGDDFELHRVYHYLFCDC